MPNMLKKGVIGWLIASLLITGGGLTAGTASAASSAITIRINDMDIHTDVAPYITNGTTMVPLQVVRSIPGTSIRWDNASKTVTLTGEGEAITLVAGRRTAKIGNREVELETPSAMKQGRVMVPLRFIAEATGAYVRWNPKQRIVFVAKASEELKEQLSSSRLSEARTAALKFPVVSSLDMYPVVDESQGQTYYFPEGRADRFFLSGGNNISYYEVTGHYSEQKWTAVFNGTPASSGLFFLPRTITKQDGELPEITTRVVFYKFMGPIGEAAYGFVEPDGKVTTLGQQGMQLHQFFEIPGEVKS